ncbi:MAG: ABC transporter ATP-binding protein [Anaerolineae bacterium]|nr:ABC transporter ATP-binding protein [Anaerolineae bacterium]
MTRLRAIFQKLRHRMRLHLALRFIWQSTPGWTITNMVLVLLQGPVPLLSLYLMKLTIDEVSGSLTTAITPSDVFGDVAVYILLMGVVTVLSVMVGLLAGVVKEAQSLAVTDYMLDIIHAKSVAVDLEYYENATYYDTMRRAQGEAAYRPMHILQNIMSLGQSLVSLLAMGALLMTFHPVITLVMVVAVIPGFLISLRYSGKMYRWRRETTSVERESSYFDWMLSGEQHAKEIRLFGLGTLFMDRFRDLRRRLRQERLQLARRQAIEGLIAQLVSTLAMYGAYALIVQQTIEGAISIGDLVIYYQAFQRGQTYLRQILTNLAGLYEDNLFLTNMYEFLDLEPKIFSPSKPRPVPRPMQAGIEFQNVNFQYPNGTRPVLEDISLTIEPGQKIALVGENGSGKTTLIKLLCRLYDPTGGAIRVDGIDLREFDLTEFRGEVSVILQDYARYNLTAQENIWLGNVSAPPDPKQITAAARLGGADGVISSLKDGYQTVLGKLFQDGEQLSIGEWQKIALSRAFLRDSQVIILDEPTSSMDAQAEYEVFESLRNLTDGHTVILISHRFSTVRMVDKIYVLADGRIVEQGSHEDLVAQNGRYAHLFRTQAQYYT